MSRFLLSVCFLCLFPVFLLSQNKSIKGCVKDAKTGEALIGCTVMLQGLSIGAITDLDGNYVIQNVAPGVYNIIIKLISYNQKIVRVTVTRTDDIQMNVSLEQADMELNTVNVVGVRRTDTDMSLIKSMQVSPLVTTGISAQQITKTNDRDASDVIRRVPGITIYDGRFVIVRGLSERYNSVWMNGGVVPSSETDSRAFSFDVIPSSMIDRLIVNKSPAPELPGDFAGGAIQVYTKNVPEANSISIGYSASYRPGSTGEQFYAIKGGKYDWLGIDDGSRALPKDFPVTLKGINDIQKLADYGKEMNKNWTASPHIALPDQRFSLGISHRFRVGASTLGNITSITYTNTNTFKDQITSNNTSEYDPNTQLRRVSWQYNDKQYINSFKVGVLHNWSWVWGNNQKLEFRNFINNIGNNRTTLRSGNDFANFPGQNILAYQYSFMDRFTYTGQLGGSHQLTDGNDNLDWTFGYSYAHRNEPDVKRFSYLLDNTDPESPYYNQYYAFLSILPDPRLAGRLFLKTKENIQNLAVNYDHRFSIDNFHPVFKSGIYIERKSREFNARLLGYQTSSSWPYTNNYQPMDSIFQDKNISPTGIFLGESSNPSDSYTASNYLYAGYASALLPVSSKFSVYTGIRLERNEMILNSFSSDYNRIPVNVDIKQMELLPSISMTYNFTPKSLLRFVYGKTINRPEFRELAPFAFYEFERAASISGNDSLKNATIHNFDMRYEFYPNPNEIITFGVFYKRFINPIESLICLLYTSRCV